MNNEPMAWMQTWQNQDGELKRTVNIEQIGKQDIPLYTHPAGLTDEEKWKLWSECPNGLVYDRVMMFADLVIRKAQGK